MSLRHLRGNPLCRRGRKPRVQASRVFHYVLDIITRNVFTRENNRESLKLLEVWNSYVEEESLFCLFSHSLFPLDVLFFFGLHSSPFITQKWGEKVARCYIPIGRGQWWIEQKIVPMPMVLKMVCLMHFVPTSLLLFYSLQLVRI